jgi:hypothetical protein
MKQLPEKLSDCIILALKDEGIMSEIKLPEKLSDCIILALKDEEFCFNSPDYIMDMNFYHTPTRSGCIVCFAGAVMAQTLEGDPNKDIDPWHFGTYNDNRLDALNSVRLGLLDNAISKMRGSLPKLLPVRLDVAPYKANRSEWRNDMSKIVELLQGHEL